MIESVIDPGLFKFIWALVGIGWCFIIASIFMPIPNIFAKGINNYSIAEWESAHKRKLRIVFIGFGFQITGLIIALIVRFLS